MSDDADARRQVTDRLSQIVWLMDPGLEEVLHVSPVYERVTGRVVEEAGRSLGSLDIIHPDDREGFGEWLDGIRADAAGGTTRDRYEREFRLLHEDGTERWVTSVVIPLRDGDDVVAVAGFSVDVSEQVAQERELMTRIDRLDDFASMVSHDLRNPLSVARGHLELFGETGDEAHLERVEGSLARIEEIADEMLALARHGVDADDSSSVSLRAVAATAWEGVETRDASLAVVDDVAVHGASEQVRLLFENLFQNAVGHGGDGVTVRVGGLQDGFYVEDTGVGIPEEDRERVFEHGHTTGYAGSGVGLTVVRRVAEAHGWQVSLVESEEGGARFEFRGEGPATVGTT